MPGASKGLCLPQGPTSMQGKLVSAWLAGTIVTEKEYRRRQCSSVPVIYVASHGSLDGQTCRTDVCPLFLGKEAG